ncbi:TlpA family protein disulfide reductase [Desulfobulbus propionicus]
MRRRPLTRLLLVLALLLLPASLPAVQEGQRLLPFKGTDLDGNSLDLGQSIGSKPVLLVFWASWCPSCKTEVPKINRLVEKFRSRGMEFFAINVGYNDSIERAKAFMEKTGMRYPAYFDGSGKVSEQYQLLGVPTILIADRHGVVRFRHFMTPDLGETTFSQLMAD